MRDSVSLSSLPSSSPPASVVVDDETRRGLDPSRRVVMKRQCPQPTQTRNDSFPAGNIATSSGDSIIVMNTRLQNGDASLICNLNRRRRPSGTATRCQGPLFGDPLLPRSLVPLLQGATRRVRASTRILQSIGVEIVAVSVDDEAVSTALVDRMRLNFTVGFGVKADEISAATGAYVAEDAAYLQSTGFVLDKQGRILTSVYSSGAIGRLVPEDVAGFVRYIESHDAAKTPAETRP